MKRVFLVGAALFIAMVASGCGGGGGGGGTVVTPIFADIPSDLTADAYVAENLNTFQLSAPVTGSGAIRVGIDPTIALPAGTEYRGLISFPLGGPGGVPADATIVSATLDIFVDSVQFQFSLPTAIRIDMIEAPPPFASTDYDEVLQPRIGTSIGFNVVGTGRYLVDITPFMEQAQVPPALPSLQLRLMLPLTPGANGLITINDSAFQPFLTVEYL